MRRLLLLALLLPPALLAGCVAGEAGEGPLVGNRAPDFTVRPVDGGNWTLSAQRGRAVVLDLMGVNCPPCREEVPHLRALARAHANDSRFALVSIDMAATYPGLGARSADEIRAFRAAFNATWPFAPDEEGRVGRAYEPIALSTIVVVGPDGVIRKKFSGGVVATSEIEEAVAAAGGR